MTNRFQMALTVNVVVAVFLISSSVCFAKEKRYYPSVNQQIETASLRSTPKTLREVFLRALLHYDWTINQIENSRINAENRDAVIEVIFLDDLVVRLELRAAHRVRTVYGQKWVKSIEKFSLRELKYNYFVQQFDFDALSKPVRP